MASVENVLQKAKCIMAMQPEVYGILPDFSFVDGEQGRKLLDQVVDIDNGYYPTRLHDLVGEALYQAQCEEAKRRFINRLKTRQEKFRNPRTQSGELVVGQTLILSDAAHSAA